MSENLTSFNKSMHPMTEVAIILLLLHNVPYIGYHTPAALFGMLVLLTYALLFFESKKRIVSNSFSCFAIISVLFLTFIAESFFEGQSFVKNAYGLMQIFLYPYLGLLFVKYDFGKTTTRIFWVVLVSYTITSITTFLGCQIVPSASRILASTTMLAESGMESVIMNLNIAGFAEVYVITLLTSLVVMMIRRGVLNKILGLLVLAAFGFGVIASEYTTALFVYSLSLLLFILPKNYSKEKYMGIMFFLIIGSYLGILLISQSLAYLSGVIDSSFVSERLLDMSSVLSGNQADVDYNSDMMTRKDLYFKSINTFLTHPLGAWDQKATGGHSFVLDSMARFGILGVISLWVMYKQIFKRFVKPYRLNPEYGYVLISFFLVVFLAIINPNPNILYMCFIIPLFYNYSRSKT